MPFHRELSRAFAGALLAASLANSALAQVAEPITLPEALARAEAQAPALSEAGADVAAAQGRTRQAGLGPNPEVRLEVENFSGSGVYSGLRGAETTLALGQTLELGGKRETRVAAGQAEIAAAQLRQSIARADLVLNVKQAFANALAARDQVDLARAAVERASNLARVAQTLVDSGREPPLRVLRAKSAASEAEAELERASAEDQAARGVLAAVLGATAAPSMVAGSFDLTPASGRVTDPTQTLDVRLAAAEADLARTVVAREQASANADVTLELGVRRFEDSRDTAMTFGASVPIPLYNRNQGAVSAANAELMGANAKRLQALADSVRRMNEADSALTAAEVRVKTLEDGAVPTAQEALGLARAGFEAGRFTLLDVLDAEEAFASAQAALIGARRDRANAAAALERALAR